VPRLARQPHQAHAQYATSHGIRLTKALHTGLSRASPSVPAEKEADDVANTLDNNLHLLVMDPMLSPPGSRCHYLIQAVTFIAYCAKY
jgi:hypothetical protein